MALKDDITAPIRHADRFYIGGEWVAPSSDATIDVIDSGTEEHFFSVAEAREADMDARRDRRPAGVRRGALAPDDPRPAGRVPPGARGRTGGPGGGRSGRSGPASPGCSTGSPGYAGLGAAATFDFYAGLADTFEWEREAQPSPSPASACWCGSRWAWSGAIIPWNGPMSLISYKVAPALIAGCTVVLKSSPEAPGEGYLVAEVAEEIGLPPGVLNVVTADREVSELLVRDPRVDKITFTGSTAAGRRIASICGERIARVTLELGGKSAAVVLDDADLDAHRRPAGPGRVHDDRPGVLLADPDRRVPDTATTSWWRPSPTAFSQVKVGNQFDPESQMGPLAVSRQRDRVLGYIEKGVAEGATLATGGGRPAHLDRGWFVEPTVFGNVDNSSTIARDEIFGPVLSVIPAEDERDAVAIANDTIYGLNASVFTADVDRAREVAGQLRAGTVGHNSFRTDFGIAFGGFKQSGIGREGGTEGLLPFLETKTVILEERPSSRPG